MDQEPTLRDLFAAAALIGILMQARDPHHLVDVQAKAEIAFMFADSMMTQRGKDND